VESELNIKDWIREEHQRAELERLETGWEGCGCRDCQEFYQTIDLSRYGNRVIRSEDAITVLEDRTLLRRNFPDDDWGEVLQFVQGQCYGITPDGRTVFIGATEAVRETLANPNRRTGNDVVDEIVDLERRLSSEKTKGGQDGRPTDRQVATRRRAQGADRPNSKRARPVYRPRNQWSHAG